MDEHAWAVWAQSWRLKRRIESLAREIAISEDLVAQCYEESAALRPHAAERLHRMAQDARAFAGRERRYVVAYRPSSPGRSGVRHPQSS